MKTARQQITILRAQIAATERKQLAICKAERVDAAFVRHEALKLREASK